MVSSTRVNFPTFYCSSISNIMIHNLWPGQKLQNKTRTSPTVGPTSQNELFFGKNFESKFSDFGNKFDIRQIRVKSVTSRPQPQFVKLDYWDDEFGSGDWQRYIDMSGSDNIGPGYRVSWTVQIGLS